MTQKKYERKDVYRMVTDRMIESLKKGVVPWKKPWKSGTGSKCLFPENFASGRPYRGINFFLLYLMAAEKGFGSNFWLTFLQCKKLGGYIKKGAQSTPVCFYKCDEITVKKDETASLFNWTEKEIKRGCKKVRKFFLTYFNVFNLCQTEGLIQPQNTEDQETETVEKMIEKAESIVQGFQDGPPVDYGFDKCFYSPSNDRIGMVEKKDFFNAASFYETLFHEFGHSTGHKNRLNREELYRPNYEKDQYSYEELVAEMTSCFLSTMAGISEMTFENHSSYINGWLKVFKGDEKILVRAASQAQKATDWILNKRDHIQSTEDN